MHEHGIHTTEIVWTGLALTEQMVIGSILSGQLKQHISFTVKEPNVITWAFKL